MAIPALHEIDGATVAAAVVAMLQGRGVDGGSLRAEIVQLVDWAKSGADGEAEHAQEALDRIVRRLFLPPSSLRGDPLAARIPRPTDEPMAAVAVAVMAARGRIRLARVHLVEPRELAALLHCDESWVRTLARSRRIERDPQDPSPRAPITEVSCLPLLVQAKVPPWGHGGVPESRCTTGDGIVTSTA